MQLATEEGRLDIGNHNWPKFLMGFPNKEASQIFYTILMVCYEFFKSFYHITLKKEAKQTPR